MVSMQDVAREANVSPMTVSNVLRGRTHKVSAETAERVRRVARDMHYRVGLSNASAISMRDSRRVAGRGVIGFIPYGLEDYPTELASHLERYASGLGFQLIVQCTRADERGERRVLDLFGGQLCDGLIVSPWKLDSDTIDRLARHRPTVLLDDDRPQTVLDTVLSPSREAAAAGIRYLAGRGCGRILVVGASLHNDGDDVIAGVSRRRLQGCLEAMRELGLPMSPDGFLDPEWSGDEAREMIRGMGARIRDWDAVFAFSDTMAVGVLRGLADLGLRVPDDIRLMTFSGTRMASMMVPSLSTVGLDIEWTARAAVDLLVDRLEGDPGAPGRTVTAPYHVASRESA